MLQNLATNTFLLDKVFSGWFLSITSGFQDSRLATGKVGGTRESKMPPAPNHKPFSKFFLSSHLQRANLEVVDMISTCLTLPHFVLLLPLDFYNISL